jgi:hypothetical protein
MMIRKIIFKREDSGVSFAEKELKSFQREHKFFRDEAWVMTNSK